MPEIQKQYEISFVDGPQPLVYVDRLNNNFENELLRVEESAYDGLGLFSKRLLQAETRVFGAVGSEFYLLQTPDQAFRFPDAILIGQEEHGLDPRFMYDCYLDPSPYNPLSYINHSCNPNTARIDHFTFAALRAIAPGEEVTADYSLLEANPFWSMACNCQSDNCRKQIGPIQLLPPEFIEKIWPTLPEFMREIYQRSKVRLEKNAIRAKVRAASTRAAVKLDSFVV